MTDIEFETLVDQLFKKHATHLGVHELGVGAEGDLGVDEYDILGFAKELKEALEKKTK